MEFLTSNLERLHIVFSHTWPTSFRNVVAVTIATAVAASALIYIVTWAYRQFSISGKAAKRFLSLGYESADGNIAKNEMVKRMKRMRKVEQMLPPYLNGWFLLFQSGELVKGESMEVSVCGTDMVAWRGESGKVYVADAYCPHLGAHLGVGGEVKQECIQCPFHGWNFDGRDGNLTVIPYSKTEKVSAKIKMHHVVEQDGLVYWWFHAEGKDPEWYPRKKEVVQGQGWKMRGYVETYINAHMQDVPENQADLMHFNYLHGPGYISGYQPYINAFSFLEFVRFEYSGKWRPNEDADKKHMAYTPDVSIDMYLFGKFKFSPAILNVSQEGPGITCFHLAYPSLGKWASTTVWIMTTPVEPMVQRLVMSAYSGPWVPSFFVTLVFEYIIVSVARDAAVWNRKTQLKNPILVKEDAGIKMYRGWINQFYTENSPCPDYFTGLDN